MSHLKQIWRKIRLKIDRQKFKFAKWRWDKKDAELFYSQEIKEIAILLKDGKLGDSIFAGIFVDLILLHRSDIEITIICPDYIKVWFDPKKPIKWIITNKSTRKSIRFFKKFQNRFDVVIELTTEIKHNLFKILHVLKAKHILGYNKSDCNLFDLNLCENIKHFSTRYYEAAQLFIPNIIGKTNYVIPKPEFLEHRNRLYELYFHHLNNTDNKIDYTIAVNLFGANKYRQFSFEQAFLFLHRWREIYPAERLILMKIPHKELFLEELIIKLNDSNIILNSLETSFPSSLALIDICDFTFTPDTSVVHMASALNKPVLAIYDRVTNYDEWCPLSVGSEAVFIKEERKRRVFIHEFDWDEFAVAKSKILARISLC